MPTDIPMVLYSLVLRREGGGGVRFLVRTGAEGPTFPPTKLKDDGDLYQNLDRIFEGDFGLPRRSFYPERELPTLDNAPSGPRYDGLPDRWLLYPVIVSLTAEARQALESAPNAAWLTLAELAAASTEPNTRAIIAWLQGEGAAQVANAPEQPTMEARANHWARFHEGGVRIVRAESVKTILGSGDRAFNLRVADPYLPYHRQGLGFTWSFFTPKDRQDLHVHGLPAVEIYGVIEGRLQLWWKPMNARGVCVWQRKTLEPGDWAEVEPLNCHFAAWLTPEGLGTVIKAAGTGELAGVGRLRVCGKNTCDWSSPQDTEAEARQKRCSNHGCCVFPPALQALMAEYQKPHPQCDYTRISTIS